MGVLSRSETAFSSPFPEDEGRVNSMEEISRTWPAKLPRRVHRVSRIMVADLIPDLSRLPRECVLQVLSHLQVKDLCVVEAVNRAHRELVRDPALWKNLAVTRWGRAVVDLKRQQPRQGWEKYCKRRMPIRTIVRSPIGLLQENYSDPWQHLLCCLLCSRTSGSATIAACVALVIDEFPSPTKLLKATDTHWKDGKSEQCPLCNLIHPLGLQAQRCKAVHKMTVGFLRDDWEDPTELYGVGKFSADSLAIFCWGMKDLRSVDDVNLKRYLRWALGESQTAERPRAHPRVSRNGKRKARFDKQSGTRRSQRIRSVQQKAMAC